jgi:HD-GYP domain-containing protein (c-di-GMP phosphodiesterase class II)
MFGIIMNGGTERGIPTDWGGKSIPVGARIIAVADTYDAIITHRPYRKSRPHDFACSEIELAAGSQLCPEVCEVFLSMKCEILRLVEVAEEEITAATSD